MYRGQFDGEGTIFGRCTIWPFDAGEFVLTIAGGTSAAEEAAEIVPAAIS